MESLIRLVEEAPLLASIWSVAFTLIVSSSQAMQNFTWLRVLRLLRMVKVLRVIRLASYFHTLRAMLTSLLDSFWMFAWSLAMLSIVYFTFSLVFVSRLGAHFSAEGPDLDLQEVGPLVRSYGSVERSMGSLLLVSTGGRDWGDDLELVGKIDQLSQVVLVVFILFSHIALMNIILGVFVEDAMKNLQPDDFQKARHLVEQEELFSRELLTLCEDMDGRSGRLSLHEWNQGLKSGRIRELLRLFGLHTHHVEKFFFMLCEQNKANGGDDSVDTAEFVRGCMRLRGTASMFDMHGLQFEVLALKELMLKELRMLRNMRPHRTSKGSSAP